MLKYIWVGKKSSSMGVVIPYKMTNCNKGVKDILCDKCDKKVKQNKKLTARLNELKRERPIEYKNLSV